MRQLKQDFDLITITDNLKQKTKQISVKLDNFCIVSKFSKLSLFIFIKLISARFYSNLKTISVAFN